MIEKLNMLEAEIKNFIPEGARFTNGHNLGLLDILMVAILGPHKAQEELFGVKFLDPEKHPFCSHGGQM